MSSHVSHVVRRVVQFVSLLLVAALPATATEVLPITLEETVHDAGAIFVGRVLNHQAHWSDPQHRSIITEYTFQVEDVILPHNEVQKGAQVVLAFWGGTIGDETYAISDMHQPEDGQRYVLMLNSDWHTLRDGTPTVGFQQGMFRVEKDKKADKELVKEADGSPLFVASGQKLMRQFQLKADVKAKAGVSRELFLDWLRTNYKRFQSMRFKPRPQPNPNDPRIMKTFSQIPVSPEVSRAQANASAEELLPLAPNKATASRFAPIAPQDASRTQMAGGSPAPAPDFNLLPGLPPAASDPSTETRPTDNSPHVQFRYSTFGGANVPIVVNPFPTSWYWSPEDQYQMSKWNYYADVFRVMTPKGSFAWPDGVFDLDGWVSQSDMTRIYNYTWGSNTLAVTLSRSSGSLIQEADIAFNPAFSWTLDDTWVFTDYNAAQGFRATMLHELGHMWGLNHQFNFLSIMNYSPQPYRAEAVPYMDDAQGIRAQYPGQAQTHNNDLAVYLWYSAGYQDWRECTHPSYVVAGDTMTLNDYHVENTGTATIATPTLEWYLTTSLNYSDPYYYLGKFTYNPLNAFTYFTTSAMSIYPTVPTGVPGGDYYLNAFIRNDEGVAAFPFDNNHGWTRSKITVYPRLTQLYVYPYVVGGNSTTGWVYLGSNTSSNGQYVTLSSDNANVSVPSYVYVSPGSYYASFTITTTKSSQPVTANLTAQSVGKYQYATLYVSVPTSLAVSNASGSIGQTVPLTATLTNAVDNSVLASTSISFSIDGNDVGSATTDSNGVATVNVPLLATYGAGSHTITAYKSYDYQYADAIAYGTLTIAKAKTAVSGFPRKGRIGDTISLISRLRRTTDSAYLSGQTITFKIEGNVIGTGTTDASGLASLSYTLPESLGAGVHKVYGEFAGDSNYGASSGFGYLTVSAGLTVMKTSAAGGRIGQTVALTANLTRKSDSTGLSGRTVTFAIGTTTLGSATTDASGAATLNYTIAESLGTGSKTFTAAFAGETNYASSKASSTLTIGKASTSISTFPTSGTAGKTITLVARLSRPADGALLSGRTLTFKVNSVAIGAAITDASGLAKVSYTIPANTPPGKLPFSVEFAGDTTHLASSRKGAITVK